MRNQVVNSVKLEPVRAMREGGLTGPQWVLRVGETGGLPEALSRQNYLIQV